MSRKGLHIFNVILIMF